MYKPYKQMPGNKPQRKPTAKKITAPQNPELHTIFLNEVAEITDAEKQLIAAWPVLSQTTTSPLLKELCNQCIAANSIHLERLQKIITMLAQQQTTISCSAVTGIIATTNNFSSVDNADDAVTITALKLLHYFIASYQGLLMMANALQLPGVTMLLNETLSELNDTVNKLSHITLAGDSNNLAA